MNVGGLPQLYPSNVATERHLRERATVSEGPATRAIFTLSPALFTVSGKNSPPQAPWHSWRVLPVRHCRLTHSRDVSRFGPVWLPRDMDRETPNPPAARDQGGMSTQANERWNSNLPR